MLLEAEEILAIGSSCWSTGGIPRHRGDIALRVYKLHAKPHLYFDFLSAKLPGSTCCIAFFFQAAPTEFLTFLPSRALVGAGISRTGASLPQLPRQNTLFELL